MKFIENKKTAKLGGYTVIVTAVVIAIVIILNLALGLLPSRFVKYSMSPQNLYEISDTSRDIVDRVKDELVINIVSENPDQMVEEYVSRYADLNSKIKVAKVDPVIRPAFLTEYTDESLDTLYTHLVLVNKSNGRSRVVTYDEIFPVQYSQEDYYYYMQTGQMPSGTTYFNVEQCLTSAVDYLTMEKLPTVYYVTGHGETAPDKTLSELIDAENIDLKELKLQSEGKIPEDATVVLINSPTKDFSAEEITVLTEFSDNGGHVILNSHYNTSLETRKLENLYGFAASLGLEYNDVLVFEGSSDKYFTYYGPHYILATVASNDFSTALTGNTSILMSYSHAITLAESAPEGVKLSELLTTSVKGYAKTEIKEDTKVEKEEGDIEGKYVLGAMAEKNGAKLIWFSSKSISDGNTASQFSNLSYFMSVLTNICEKEDSVTINSKSLQVEALTVSESSSNLWGIILIAVIPLVFLGGGFFLWNRRVKR